MKNAKLDKCEDLQTIVQTIKSI